MRLIGVQSRGHLRDERRQGERGLILPEGGSFNTTRFRPRTVVKRYDGPVDRGHAKLRNEHTWLRELPETVAGWFALPVYFAERAAPHVTELHLKRELQKTAVAKAILRDMISPVTTGEIVAEAVRFLVEELYPIRWERLTGFQIYERYHAGRIAVALDALDQVPALRLILHARKVIVNGRVCPSFAEIKRWMDEEAPLRFRGGAVVKAHGDAHLDNVLTTTTGWPPHLTFIDPRGESLLPPHYDFAKLLKELRAAYDLIHYGRYSCDVRASEGSVTIDLAVAGEWWGHYDAGLDALSDAVPLFARAEGITTDQFLQAAVVAEMAHVISFARYHASRPGNVERRVVAYLAVAALMARDVMDANAASPSVHTPLLGRSA